ncbi:MAG: UbiA prenyltransferase family protein [Thaumarchaeota archaeon]|nr:UbiA prenyltransferase family protein [Nitrososphaerota archaeon]
MLQQHRRVEKRLIVGLIFGTLRVQRTFPTVVASAAFLFMLGENHAWRIVAFSLSTFLFHISASAFNDLSDIRADMFNAPERPFVQGKISKKALATLASTLFSLGVALASIVDLFYGFLSATLGLLYVLLYSFFVPMKNNPLGSFLYLSASGLAVPFTGATIIGRSIDVDTLVSIMVLTLLGACATISAVKDIDGDAAVGKNTFAVTLGFRTARMLVSGLILLPVTLYPFVPVLFNISSSYLQASLLLGVSRFILAWRISLCALPHALGRYSPAYRVLIAGDAASIALTATLGT